MSELGRFSEQVLGATDDAARLRLLAESARSLLACPHVAVSTVTRRRLEVAHALGDTALLLTEAQHELEQGPDHDVVQTRATLAASYLDGAWPEFGTRARERGVGSLVAVPLRAEEGVLAVVTAYGERPAAFDDDDVTALEVLAGQATLAVVTGREVEQLTTALVNRTVIGQAEGILMERLGLSEESAFAYLRRVSQDLNRRLVVLAEEIVRTRRLPRTDDPQSGQE